MEKAIGNRRQFTKKLVIWNETDNNRELPWKGENDPYKIWLAEIILQQTRALQGLPYYIKFIASYPTIEQLAAAADDDVFRLWQGLGYYSRCKNLLYTARMICNEMGGSFPSTYEGLLALKGVGPYTAAAIASFAFGLPQAVVDGNVYRVLSRYFGIDTPFDTVQGKKEFALLAQDLLDKNKPAGYNQAIMDMGATICLPANALCEECPLMSNCFAFHNQLVNSLPVKSKKILVRKRYFNFIFLLYGEKVWVEKRGSGDIWENLYQPYLIEALAEVGLEELSNDELFVKNAFQTGSVVHSGTSKQRLTHQLIVSNFYSIECSQLPILNNQGGIWLNVSELKKIGFPKTLVSFLIK